MEKNVKQILDLNEINREKCQDDFMIKEYEFSRIFYKFPVELAHCEFLSFLQELLDRGYYIITNAARETPIKNNTVIFGYDKCEGVFYQVEDTLSENWNEKKISFEDAGTDFYRFEDGYYRLYALRNFHKFPNE